MEEVRKNKLSTTKGEGQEECKDEKARKTAGKLLTLKLLTIKQIADSIVSEHLKEVLVAL